MQPITTIFAFTAVSAILAGAAVADANHSHGMETVPAHTDGPAMGMQAMRMHGRETGGHGMMKMMMQMHGRMMGATMPAVTGGAMPGMGKIAGGLPGMSADLPGLGADVDGDGLVTPEELRSRLQSLHGEYDTDGNGSLSLDEFAALHADLIRETMVDRFQFFDADGDGAVTMGEIVEPADRFEQMTAMRERMMEEGGPDRHRGTMPNQGEMMEDN